MGGGFIGSSSTNLGGYDNSGSANIFYMYKKNAYFGIETGFNLLGNFERSATNSLFSDALSGFHASFVGIIPINKRLDFYGKVGGIAWTARSLFNNDTLIRDESGTSLTYGIGLQIGIIDLMSLRLELQQYNDIGRHDISNAAVNVIFHFR
jgi:opacity protein-like surface antigen